MAGREQELRRGCESGAKEAYVIELILSDLVGVLLQRAAGGNCTWVTGRGPWWFLRLSLRRLRRDLSRSRRIGRTPLRGIRG